MRINRPSAAPDVLLGEHVEQQDLLDMNSCDIY